MASLPNTSTILIVLKNFCLNTLQCCFSASLKKTCLFFDIVSNTRERKCFVNSEIDASFKRFANFLSPSQNCRTLKSIFNKITSIMLGYT